MGILYPLLGGKWNTPAALAVATAYMFMPMIAAIVAQKLVMRENLKEPLAIRFKLNRWFAVAWLLPPVIAGATFGVSLLLPGVEFAPEMEGFLARLQETMTPEQYAQMQEQMKTIPIAPIYVMILQALIAAITVNAVAGFGEELGWRGFLYKEWKHLGFRRLSLLTGATWGIWHAPLILQGHNYPHFPVAGVFMMIIFCILWAPLFTLVRMKSGSVIAASILHGSINASIGISIVYVKGGNELLIGGTGLAGFIVLVGANALVWVFRHKLIVPMQGN
ncbi:MAG: CPBP family intramembrane metalloprotease [Chitinivibrionales bacterium]|nr:CPBP family intramembrane metalloprotease [Chitinivibrionales bacterium]